MVLFGRGLFIVSVAEERGWLLKNMGGVVNVLPKSSMLCQTALEIAEVFLLRVRPQYLGQGGHAGHDHVFHVFWGKDVLCPNVGLRPQNISM
jgi:hypothetical protein